MLDALAVLRDFVPLVARRNERTRLNALRDLMNLLVGQLFAARDPEPSRRGRVARDRLAIGAGLAANLPVALPRRPAAEYFLDVNHRELPERHRFLPTTTGAVRRDESGPLQVARSGWPHDPAKTGSGVAP